MVIKDDISSGIETGYFVQPEICNRRWHNGDGLYAFYI